MNPFIFLLTLHWSIQESCFCSSGLRMTSPARAKVPTLDRRFSHLMQAIDINYAIILVKVDRIPFHQFRLCVAFLSYVPHLKPWSWLWWRCLSTRRAMNNSRAPRWVLMCSSACLFTRRRALPQKTATIVCGEYLQYGADAISCNGVMRNIYLMDPWMMVYVSTCHGCEDQWKSWSCTCSSLWHMGGNMELPRLAFLTPLFFFLSWKTTDVSINDSPFVLRVSLLQ